MPKGQDMKAICKIFAKFEWTGSVDDNQVRNFGPWQTLVTPRNVANVYEILQRNLRNNVGRIALDINLKPFLYVKYTEKHPVSFSMQNPKSSDYTHKSFQTKGWLYKADSYNDW